MGTWRRSARDWVLGWSPSSDLVNGNPAGLLRADNVTLDELGVLSLRKGTEQTLPGYTTALPGGELWVDSLYNAVLNSSPTTLSVSRVVAASDGRSSGANPCSGSATVKENRASVYINGVRRDSCIPGSGDVSLHHGYGHIFWTRSTRHRKNDGSGAGGDDGRGTRNWGIAAPTVAPTFNVTDPDGATFSTCDAGEVPAWEANEGSVGNVDGNDGSGGGAIEIQPTSTTGVGTATRLFGGAQDFTQYDGGDTGIDEDVIELYLKISVPKNLTSLSLLFDCTADEARPFQDDYYSFEFQPDVVIQSSPESMLNSGKDAAATREAWRAARENTRQRQDSEEGSFGGSGRGAGGSSSGEDPASTLRNDAEWLRMTVPRKSFMRTGGDSARGWTTITGIRLVATSLSLNESFGSVAVDNITISGGANHPFTGTYVARYRWVKNFSTYVALSPPSPPSDAVLTKANGLSVNISAANVDPQADECWVYLFGGALNGFYRFASVAFDGTDMTVDVNQREATAAIENITLDLNDTVPPDDIVGIAGPYYGRFVCLTPTGVHLSRFNNPDTFSLNEVIKLGDGGEVPYWIISSDGRLLVGTSSAIRQISGTLVSLPDGTIDARVDDLNTKPPNDFCVAVDGPVTAYLAADGPRILVGNNSKIIVGNLDLLLREGNRYGVPIMNLGLAPGRTRMAIRNRFLYMVTPETWIDPGTGDPLYDAGSPYVYRYDMGADRWWRFKYPWLVRSVYRDPADLLEFGTNDGQVFLGEVGTTDSGAGIVYYVQTVSDDLGTPMQRKDFHDLIVNCNSGSSASGFSWYADQAATPALVSTVLGTEAAPIHQEQATALDGAKRVGLIIEGLSTTGWKLYDYALNTRERPMPRVRWDTGYTPLASTLGRELVWFRRMNLTANSPVDLKALVYFSGVLYATYPVAVIPNVTDVYWIPIDRACKGRQPIIVLVPLVQGEEETAFECYKLGFQLRNTGSVSEWKYAEWAPEI